MPFKDHYKTLGVSLKASSQEIKAAYRALAHQYHPDKNNSEFAAARFREIREAYAALSDVGRRKQYDEERYFAGLSATREPSSISSGWILKEAAKLEDHMRKVDSFRMNQQALHDYVLLLLSDAHIAVLEEEDDQSAKAQIISHILASVRHIQYRWFPDIAQRLELIAGTDEKLLSLIHTARTQRKINTSAQNWMPFIVLMVTLVLCLLMFWYSRR
ncbi:MAG: hypothetical protein EOP49_36165 [Sphingobacteriales bacterium]|nr:MAG: hypothetical protein EOP49_36165 [Sphingobacteriales bacterium]